MAYKSVVCVLALAALGGCGGEYILTAPDVVALPGENAPVVVRLQRREFWVHCPPTEGVAITFRTADGQLRCARTDEDGYAAVGMPVPEEPSRQVLQMHLQDSLGYTASGAVSVFVLQPDRPVAVVDLDSLPAAAPQAESAAQALARVARGAQIVYVSGELGDAPTRARQRLADRACPVGAVLPWGKRHAWYARLIRAYRQAEILPALRHRLEKLRWGVTADAKAAERLKAAGLDVLLVGGGNPASARPVKSWAELKLPSPAGTP